MEYDFRTVCSDSLVIVQEISLCVIFLCVFLAQAQAPLQQGTDNAYQLLTIDVVLVLFGAVVAPAHPAVLLFIPPLWAFGPILKTLTQVLQNIAIPRLLQSNLVGREGGAAL